VRACKQTLLYNVLDALTSSQVQVGQASCSSQPTTCFHRMHLCCTVRHSAVPELPSARHQDMMTCAAVTDCHITVLHRLCRVVKDGCSTCEGACPKPTYADTILAACLLCCPLPPSRPPSRQAVVFGVSCAYDVQDSMEKRVRSRFSNRKIFLPGLGSAKVMQGASGRGWGGGRRAQGLSEDTRRGRGQQPDQRSPTRRPSLTRRLDGSTPRRCNSQRCQAADKCSLK